MIRHSMGMQRGVHFLCLASPCPIDIPLCRRFSSDKQTFVRKLRPSEHELVAPNDNRLKNDYNIKLLCPSLVTELMPEYGSIWMKDIMNQSSAEITMSLDGEHFPLTDERVIAISGTYSSISRAVDVIVKDMLKPPHKPMTRGRYPQPVELPQHVRVLIPQMGKDMIVGEEGHDLLSISGISKCDFYMEDYENVYDSFERIMTIRSDRDTEHLVYGTQLFVKQVMIALQLHPYVVKGVTYGNGRFERVKFEKPEMSSFYSEPQKPYSAFLNNLIANHRRQLKDPATGKYIKLERSKNLRTLDSNIPRGND